MKRVDFNKGWTCKCLTREEGPAYPVTLPHDAMRTEARTNESAGEGNLGWYIGGDYVYRKAFTLPEELRGKQLLLEFESVYRNAEVSLNGEKIAFRPYGYTNFYVDLTGKLKDGENVLEVIARNADQPNSRWYSGTGIYRPVWLWTASEKYIPVNGIRITTTDYKTGSISVTVKTSQPGTVKVEILDGAKTVASAAGESADGQANFYIKIPSCKLWSTEQPNLYTCRVTFGDDLVEEPFGMRTLAWDPDRGITINGKRVILRGACIHHDNGILGACAFPEAEERRVRLHKENGYNALRSSHYPCSKAMLAACDKLGVLMMDEYIDHWYIHKTKYDYVPYFDEWWKQDLTDMVDKDYNHPCVILYSTGNEVAETAQPKGIALTAEMTNWLHTCDPTRPVTCGINIFFNFLNSIGMGAYSDDKAEKAAANAEKPQKPKKKAAGSEFYNMLAVKVGDKFMKWGATLPPCDWKTKDAYAAMDVAGYNYGLWRYKHDLKKYPNRLILGSETFCKDAYAFWEIAKDNPRIVGDFVWTGMDYLGEVGEGCAEYSDYKFDDEPCRRLTGGNGRIDLLGKRRAEACYTLVALEQAKGPFIGVIPVYQTEHPAITGWQLTKALESWSWRGCTDKEAKVEVYARAAEVELLLNEKSVGRKKMNNTVWVTFKVPYADGTLTAVSYGTSGKEIGRCSLKTAGEKTVLQVQPEEKTVAPEGLSFVWLRYTDPAGIWKPMEKHQVQVSVENGTLMGVGSANPYAVGNLAGDKIHTFYGEAMAIVRANESGPVRLTVTDEQGTKVTTEIPCAKK